MAISSNDDDGEGLIFHIGDPGAQHAQFMGPTPGKQQSVTAKPLTITPQGFDNTSEPQGQVPKDGNCPGCDARRAAIGRALAPLARLIFGK